MAGRESGRVPPRCSFCGKSADQVAKVVAGPDAYICNECIALCNDIMEAETASGAGEGEGKATAPPPQLVLASSSAARLRVLRDAGFDPVVEVSGVDEAFDPELTPGQAVVLLAERKARAVARQCPDSLVVGCDSMLEFDGVALGKPRSGVEAGHFWRRLSGRQGTLHTGHCVIDTRAGRSVRMLASSLVEFGSPSEAELRDYTSSTEPLSLAGAFSIEGLSGPFVNAIHGSSSNVLGLSLPHFRSMVHELGHEIVDLWSAERIGRREGNAGEAR